MSRRPWIRSKATKSQAMSSLFSCLLSLSHRPAPHSAASLRFQVSVWMGFEWTPQSRSASCQEARAQAVPLQSLLFADSGKATMIQMAPLFWQS